MYFIYRGKERGRGEREERERGEGRKGKKERNFCVDPLGITHLVLRVGEEGGRLDR